MKLAINNLDKSFKKLKVLDDLCLNINHPGVFVVLGPNGSGKTTLLKSILGMVHPDKGDIKIDEKSVLKKWKYRTDINYLPQIANFPSNISINELLTLIKKIRREKSNEIDLIENFNLTNYLDKKLSTLSGGTKQKVNILLTFMFDSQLIILDEPTTGLDPVSLLVLKKIISDQKKNGKIILITTHIMSFVEEIADEIVFILDGKIYFQGSIKRIKKITNTDNVEKAIAHILTKQND
jgi:Cu-processing system ATP-binding protein